MTIKTEIEALKQDGIIHAEAVESWAKANPESALHRALEWDAEKGAYQYRLYQIRRLIQIHVVEEDRTPKVVSLSIDRTRGGGYRDLREVAATPDLLEILLRDAIGELRRVQAKYAMIKALAKVWGAVDDAHQAMQVTVPPKAADHTARSVS